MKKLLLARVLLTFTLPDSKSQEAIIMKEMMPKGSPILGIIGFMGVRYVAKSRTVIKRKTTGAYLKRRK